MSTAIAISAIAIVVLMQSMPPAPVPLPRPRPIEPSPDPTIESRWPRAIPTVTYVDHARVVQADDPAPAPETTQATRKHVAAITPSIFRARRERRAYAYDICRGKGRYFTNGGRSWRCNR